MKNIMQDNSALEEGDYGTEQKMIALFALQQIDSGIDRIKTIRGELPLEVQDLEDDVEGFKVRIEKMEKDFAEIQQNIAHRKEAISEHKAFIKKYEKQQKEVKNNREYESLNKEIEFQGLEIQLNEKRIREATIASEKMNYELERLKNAFEERQKDLALKQSELGEIVAETEKEEQELTALSESFSEKVESRWLHNYKRIRANAKNGLAVVCIERDACGGCFSKIPPQRQIDIQMHRDIISCEYCGRYLVDPDIKEKAASILEEK